MCGSITMERAQCQMFVIFFLMTPQPLWVSKAQIHSFIQYLWSICYVPGTVWTLGIFF